MGPRDRASWTGDLAIPGSVAPGSRGVWLILCLWKDDWLGYHKDISFFKNLIYVFLVMLGLHWCEDFLQLW